MGGSQVYLDPKEQFPLEELLYALMIQSANDAAVALASHVAGTKEAFVELMNEKAQELGMKNTSFATVHGLPPSKGQQVDVTTARDFGILCQNLSKRPEVYKYTGTKVRDFRGGEFIMRTHNHLLDDVEGCDGFKTGYFTKAGFSIAATAKRNGVRLIAIVMGSKDRKVRDAKTTELLNKGFTKVPAKPKVTAPEVIKTTAVQQKDVITPPTSPKESTSPSGQPQKEINAVDPPPGSGWIKFFVGIGVGLLLFAALNFFRIKKRGKGNRRIRKY
jgi:D-alanyl-D-alanine carboxypeptidase (penicillin-binding protein 5/6)